MIAPLQSAGASPYNVVKLARMLCAQATAHQQVILLRDEGHALREPPCPQPLLLRRLDQELVLLDLEDRPQVLVGVAFPLALVRKVVGQVPGQERFALVLVLCRQAFLVRLLQGGRRFEGVSGRDSVNDKSSDGSGYSEGP